MTRKQLALLLLLAIGTVLVHGYHAAAEDAEIYLPAIKKDLNPALYPFGSEFVMSQARMTLFDELVAGSIRITHAPFDYAVFLWHFAAIFLFLAGCWRVGRQCFPDRRAAPWAGTALVAALLTIPVAGTALYIMDQYLNPRDLSTAGIMLVLANVMEKRFVRAGLWTLLVAIVHPLMAVFGIVFIAMLLAAERRPALLRARKAAAASMLFLFPVSFAPAISDAYRQALHAHTFLFLRQWDWYSWIGIFAPAVLLWLIGRYGRKHGLRNLEALSQAAIWFTAVFFVAGLVITIPERFASLVLLQPLRSLHLVFILLFVLGGGVLAETVLKNHLWRWLALLLPLCLVMFYVQRVLFPASPHIELPGRVPDNPWMQAFDWVRRNTPQDAIFALDPDYTGLPGEDQHGFRALAERSKLADHDKDGGPVTLFPALAATWHAQVAAQEGWKNFQLNDFRRLQQQYGVSWVVVQAPAVAGLTCPYQNPAVAVCRIQ